MQFTATIVAFVALVASATAVTLPQTVNLFNGEGVTAATVGGVAERGVLDTRNVCSGSSKCSNSQDMKNACAGAYSRLQGTLYSDGGAKSGVCDSHCGLFVQGKYRDATGKKVSCTADLAMLSNAFQAIQGQGCQTCGWVTTQQSNDCRIKVDYVSSC